MLPPGSHHLSQLPRRFPVPVQVFGIGTAIGKCGSMWNARFHLPVFSFVLRGNGTYRMDDRSWPVVAPCVLIQRPDHCFWYGPEQTWDEIYISFAGTPSSMTELTRLGYMNLERPIWHFADRAPVLALFEDLAGLLPRAAVPGIIDRIDRVCEHLVLASLVHAAPPPTDEASRVVSAIRNLVEERLLDPHDFDHLAVEHGLSPAGFRRAWNRIVGVPPQRHLMQLRMRRACRLLSETVRPIADIAGELGFDDPLYFSRRFHEVIGETASAYRLRHRAGPLGM